MAPTPVFKLLKKPGEGAPVKGNPDRVNGTTICAPGYGHVVTLLRGRVYVFDGVHFKKGEPEPVDYNVAQYLEEQVEEITDNDGEAREKRFFKVEYNVPLPEKKPLAPTYRNTRPRDYGDEVLGTFRDQGRGRSSRAGGVPASFTPRSRPGER